MAQQVFRVQPQSAPLPLVRHHSGGPAGAVGDRATDISGPGWRTVFTHSRNMQTAIQLAHGFAGTETTGEEFSLTFGHRTLNARRHLQLTTLKVAVDQLERIKMSTHQYRSRQGLWQRPMPDQFRSRWGGRIVESWAAFCRGMGWRKGTGNICVLLTTQSVETCIPTPEREERSSQLSCVAPPCVALRRVQFWTLCVLLATQSVETCIPTLEPEERSSQLSCVALRRMPFRRSASSWRRRASRPAVPRWSVGTRISTIVRRSASHAVPTLRVLLATQSVATCITTLERGNENLNYRATLRVACRSDALRPLCQVEQKAGHTFIISTHSVGMYRSGL